MTTTRIYNVLPPICTLAKFYYFFLAATDRATDLRLTGRGFESWLGTKWFSACYLHLCASVTKQNNLVLAKRCDHFDWESNGGPDGK